MKKTIIILTMTLMLIGIIASATAEVQSSPEMEEYKKAVEKANAGFWDWLFVSQTIADADNWGTCGSYIFPYSTSECNPCSGDNIASNCFYGCYNDGWSTSMACCYSMSSCSDWLCCGVTNAMKECYCTAPQQQCSGGADPGDKKCSSGDVWECNSNGAWEIKESCDYTCENGVCFGECDSDSDCGSDGEVGSKYCKDGNVYQKYRTYDCSNFMCDYDEDEKLIDTCITGENCIGGACVSSCIPKTCSQLGLECGLQNDGCGNQIDCGSCIEAENCIQGICKIEECIPNCVGKKCGSDGCDGTCGTCGENEICNNGLCIETADCISNSDCKTLAEVVCDDESLWYKSYSCIDGQCRIGIEIPPKSCIADKPEVNYLLQIAIGVIAIFMIGMVGFIIYKRKE